MTRDIPADSVAVGNPPRVVCASPERERHPVELMKKRWISTGLVAAGKAEPAPHHQPTAIHYAGGAEQIARADGLARTPIAP